VRVRDLPNFDDVLEEHLRDPEFRARWERTALGRALADGLVRYRADHHLTQRQLAERLGWKQPAVARLELGERNPDLPTLIHIAQRLGISVNVSIEGAKPAGRRRFGRAVKLAAGGRIRVSVA
jgi:DNA-binding XRE family transcriptional regulator